MTEAQKADLTSINKGNSKKVLANELCDKRGFTESKLETWTDYVYVDDDTRHIYVACSHYFYKIICDRLKPWWQQ